jgi:hypothetical protein
VHTELVAALHDGGHLLRSLLAVAALDEHRRPQAPPLEHVEQAGRAVVEMVDREASNSTLTHVTDVTPL